MRNAAAAAGSLGRTDIARWLDSGRRDIASAEWSVVWWGGTAGAAGCDTILLGEGGWMTKSRTLMT